MESFGIEIGEVWRLIQQIGFVLAGSASLWGFFYSIKMGKATGRYRAGLELIVSRIMPFLVVGLVIGLVGWYLVGLEFPPVLQSHEGISLEHGVGEITEAMRLKQPFAALAAALVALGLIFRNLRRRFTAPFYLSTFILSSVLVSLPAWTGEALSGEQVSVYLHGWHSILTLGTVIMVDYLFHLSDKNELIRRSLYPNFDSMSRVIWLGLGIDFLSAFLIFPEALSFTPKFYFMQTLVGIIIINGVLLSGPCTKKLVSLIRSDESCRQLAGGWAPAAGISGVISIVSWSSITVLDFLSGLTLSFLQLALIYLTIIGLGVLFYFIVLNRHPLSAV